MNDKAVTVLLGAYFGAVCLYAGWRLGRAILLRDQETARLRHELWELQAAQRKAAEPAHPEVAA